MWLAYTLAAVLSVGFGLIELLTQLRTRPTLHEGAWPYWVGRIALDGGAAVLAVVGLSQFENLPWDNDALTGVIAGTSAPALLRQHWTHVGATPIGVATAYDFARNFFDGGIRNSASERDSKWIEERVIPDLLRAGIAPRDIAARLIRWVNGRDDIDEPDRLDLQATIRANVDDPKADDRRKIEMLIDLALEQKAFRTIENLHEAARQRLRPPGRDPG